MPQSAVLNLDALQAAVCKGVVEGNRGLVTAITEVRDKNHDLRGVVQANADKVYALDREVGLLKGFIYTLMGSGDGSTGSVPRLEREVSEMGEKLTALTVTVNSMAANITTLVEAKEKSTGFMAGFSGAKVALGILATVVAIMAFLLGRGFHL